MARKCYVVATVPSLEKVVDDRFFLIRQEAVEKCKGLNKQYGGSTFKVYAVVVSFHGSRFFSAKAEPLESIIFSHDRGIASIKEETDGLKG